MHASRCVFYNYKVTDDHMSVDSEVIFESISKCTCEYSFFGLNRVGPNALIISVDNVLE